MSRHFVTFAVLSLAFPAATAWAQPLGTFRWQFQPYCNVITLNVTQQTGVYTLDGTDDRCGDSQRASARGLAFMNPDGSIGFGLTIVPPGATPVHIEAIVDLATLNGTWRDSLGGSGSFIFTPGPGTGGSPRPSGGHLPRVASAGGDQTVALSVTSTVVRTVSLTAPAAGWVVVQASGYFSFSAFNNTNAGRCTITTGASIDFNNLIIGGSTIGAEANFMPFAGTRAFNVGPGMSTFNLACDEAIGSVSVGDTQLTATYIGQ